MPGLKKLISSIKLGKERHREPPVIEPQPALHRANARLHKRHRSTLNIGSGLGLVHDTFPIRDGLQCSRTHSFEPGQSEDEFEAKSHRFNKKSKVKPCKRLNPHSGGNRSLPPVLGLTPTSAAAPIGPSITLSTSHLPPHREEPKGLDEHGSTTGRYGLDVHPSNLTAASTKNMMDGLHRSPQLSTIKHTKNDDVETRLDLRNSLRTIDEDEDSVADEDASIDVAQLESSKKRGKRKVPVFRDICWNPMSEEEVRETPEAYGSTLITYFDDASPADSAIAFREDEGAQRYKGKGKGRASGLGWSSDLNKAIDAWLAMEDTLNHEDGPHQSGRSCHNDNVGISDEEMKEEGILGFLESEQIIEGERGHLVRIQEMERQLAAGEERLRRLQVEEDRIHAQRLQEQLEKEQEEQDRIRAREVEEQLWSDQEEAALLAAERARPRECVVCGDCKESFDYPAKAPTHGCVHPPSTCNECLQSWMISEFETKGCEGIKCPECSEILQYSDVQESASTETFEAYDKLATRNALGELDEFAWCLKAGCGSGQLNTENRNYMDCASCGYKQCLRHKILWHSGETCDQYEYRTSGQKARDEENKTEAMLDTVSKRCPGPKCGWRIQKSQGCDHMTCKKCKFEFCWQCLASHDEVKRVGNTAHARTCKFHSTNLDVTWPFNMH